MIPNLQPYPKYKDSDVGWLGQIPENWKITRNKSYLRYRKDTVGDSSDSYTLLSLTLKGIIKRDMDNPQGKFPAEFNSYKIVKQGDLIFCLFDIDETPRTVGLSSYNGMITGAYDILYSDNQKVIDYLYLYYLAIDNIKGLRPLYSGLRKVVPKDVFMSMKIALPSEDEQVLIVRYLKYTNSRIQQYIAAKQKLIKLLEEQKHATIHQAVTGAIDVTTGKPYLKYKESGVEWLGKVPESWSITTLKKQSRYVKTGNTPININESHLSPEGINWFTPGDFNGELYLTNAERKLNEAGLKEVKLFPSQTIMMIGIGATIGKIAIAENKFCCNQQINCIVLKESLDTEYIAFFLKNLKEIILITGKFTTMPIINQEDTKSLLLTIPSLVEQQSISLYIKLELSKISRAVGRAKREIELLYEFRTRLTTDVVTGKVDVREATKNLPEASNLIVDEISEDDIEVDEKFEDSNEL